MKKIIPIIIIAGLLLTGYYYFIFKDKNTQQNNNITLYGNVDIRQVNLGFRVPGRIKEMLYDEGDFVKKGDTMAHLDKNTFLNDLNKSKAELLRAQANYQKMINGTRPEDIKQALSVVNETEAAYKNSVILYERQLNLSNKGAISKQDFDNTLALKDQAEARYNKAKEAYQLANKGFRKEEKSEAFAQIKIADSVIDMAQTNLDDTKIIAPNEGIILTRIEEPGAIVNSGTPVYTLSLTKPVWVRTYITEKELGVIYPGMKAKVYTDSNPDKPYNGKVGFISPVAEFTPKNVETTTLRTDLVYRIRVVIEKPDKGLRQGMPVTVKLLPKKPEKKNAE